MIPMKLSVWLDDRLERGLPHGFLSLWLCIEPDGPGRWNVGLYGSVRPADPEGLVCLSGEYPWTVAVKGTARDAAVRAGGDLASYLQAGSYADKLKAFASVGIVDEEGNRHIVWDRERHLVTDPLKGEKRMTFLFVIGLLAVIIPSVDPASSLFGILAGLYVAIISRQYRKRHRKALTAFVLGILAVVIGVVSLATLWAMQAGGEGA